MIPFLFIAICISLFPIQPFTDWFNNRPVFFLLISAILYVGFSAWVSFRYSFSLEKLKLLLQSETPHKEQKKKFTGLARELIDLYQTIDAKFSRMEEKHNLLISEKKMFDSTVRNMNDGIFIIDENEIVTLINPSASKIFGIKPEDAIGCTLTEAFRNFRLNELHALCRKSGRQENMSFDIAPNKAYIQCIATPLAPELPENYLFLIQDLTRLRQLEIVRRDFVSNVSHELRTPLASLKLIAETLQEGALNDPPAAKKFLERMEGEIDNLTQLVGELLELSRIESGKVPLDKKWINPAELVRGAEERMQLQAERAGINLKTDVEENLPNFYIDRSRLEQVLVNLLHNSIKFTNPGGEIKIRVENQNDEFVFHIRDTGVGIPAKDLERIFERFYKTDRSRTERGTGLGLSISRHLVEAHQGKIWAQSTPGEGSTFSFSIPIH
ncbi:MAG: PAS domain-containing protein [Chloroflexi bacterium]|nr:PAS domain-containing protein [Chloroflexota bacterium]